MAPRAPRPEDLYDLRVPIQLDVSPDGRQVAFAVKSVAPGRDGAERRSGSHLRMARVPRGS